MEGRERRWGTLSPKPLGIYRFVLPQQKGVAGRPSPWGGSSGASRFCCCRSRSALGSHPCVALSSVGTKGVGFQDGTGCFPFPLPWGSLGKEAGKGEVLGLASRGSLSW